jgi:hypothetical protein
MPFPFKNYTRYNTQDLEEIVEYAAKYAIASHASARGVSPEAGEVTFRTNVQLIEFYDFTPSNPVETTKTWNGKDYDLIKTRRYVGRTVWSHMERIPLLVPRMLFDPLESLAAAQLEVPFAPAAMVQRVFVAILDRFEYDRWGAGLDARNASTNHLSLRIEPKPANKVNSDVKERDRLRRAIAQVEAARYELRDVILKMRKVAAGLDVASKHVADDTMAHARFKARHLLSESELLIDGHLGKMVDDMKARRVELGGTDEEV